METSARLPGWGCAQVAALVQYAQTLGIAPEHCLRDTGLCVEKLNIQDPSLSQELRVIENLLEDANEPAFRLGVAVGKNCHIGTFGLLGQTIVSFHSLRELVDFINTYISENQHFIKVSPKFRFNQITTTFTLTQDVSQETADFLLGRDMGGAIAYQEHIMAGLPTFVREVGFIGPELPGMAEIGEYYDCPVHYHQAQNYLISKLSFSDVLLPMGNKFLSRILNSRVEEEIQQTELKSSKRVSELVRQELERTHFQNLSRDQMADQLNMSVRTLSRYLLAEGTNWRDLTTELRMAKAKKLIRDSHLSIEEIAHNVGFSSASAFSVAFSRSTGLSPQEFRKPPKILHPQDHQSVAEV